MAKAMREKKMNAHVDALSHACCSVNRAQPMYTNTNISAREAMTLKNAPTRSSVLRDRLGRTYFAITMPQNMMDTIPDSLYARRLRYTDQGRDASTLAAASTKITTPYILEFDICCTTCSHMCALALYI